MPQTEAGETSLEMAERHVREIKREIIDQERRVALMEGKARLSEAGLARDLLATMRATLQVAQEHLAIERRKSGADPHSAQ